jgi:hypothetical protein
MAHSSLDLYSQPMRSEEIIHAHLNGSRSWSRGEPLNQRQVLGRADAAPIFEARV